MKGTPKGYLILMEQWIVNGCMLGNPIYNPIGFTFNRRQAEDWVDDTAEKSGARMLALKVAVEFDSKRGQDDFDSSRD